LGIMAIFLTKDGGIKPGTVQLADVRYQRAPQAIEGAGAGRARRNELPRSSRTVGPLKMGVY
jgi:hypothetical protein